MVLWYMPASRAGLFGLWINAFGGDDHITPLCCGLAVMWRVWSMRTGAPWINNISAGGLYQRRRTCALVSTYYSERIRYPLRHWVQAMFIYFRRDVSAGFTRLVESFNYSVDDAKTFGNAGVSV